MLKSVMQITRSQVKTRLEGWATGLSFTLLGLWLALRLSDGSLNYYLHPRFNLPIALTALIFTFLGGWILWQKNQVKLQGSGQLTAVLLLVVVTGLGLGLAPRPLETNPASTSRTENNNRNLTELLSKRDWKDAANLNSAGWNLLDWSAALNDPQRAEKLMGQKADLIGFVVPAPTSSDHYFFIARYVVVCCTADSTALRLPVIPKQAQDLEEGQWVRVTGRLGQSSNGVYALLAEQLETIGRPAQPYIYP